MPDTVLHRLLTDNNRFALSHRGTVNHLPMALVALAHMGAGEARLKAYFDWWEVNVALPREGPEAPIAFANWRGALGNGAAFHPLAEAIRAEIAARGTDAVIADLAPTLLEGPGTLAFHALIRLAYGLDAGHDGEVAAAMAAWVATFRDLDLRTGDRPAASSAKDGLDAVAAAVGGRAPMPGSITGAMAAVAKDEAFRAALSGAPAVDGDLLGLLARASLRLYGQFPNFTVIHMITATHAARVLFERVPALVTPAAAEALWGAWLAAYATVGAPAFEDRAPEGAALDWPALFAAAVAGDDDHVIKLTYSCWREAGAHGDDLAYRTVATRLVGLA
ncbi:MAG: DUF4243 domain-containing protein [Proteobacteria bacterium]|nr:DUF4243 domain-containing protein [Pseudomonadota bacterium]